MTRRVRKITTAIKRKRRDLWSRMQEDFKETWNIIKRPLKKDAAGNIKNGEIAHKVGDAAWSGYITTLDLTSAVFLWFSHKIAKGALDNKAIDLVEKKYAKQKVKKNKDGKLRTLPKLTKKFSRQAAYVTYYAMLLGLLAGAYGMYNKDNIKENAKNKIENVKSILSKKDITKIKLNPNSDDFINQCIELENITCIPIIYTETYRETPVVQYGENVWTRGFGMTWSRDANGRMKIRDYDDSEYNRKKNYKPHKPEPDANMDASIEDTQQYLKDYVYGQIKDNMTREMTAMEFVALCVAGYQLPGHIPLMCQQLSNAKTPQKIADAFMTPTMYNYGGTPKRRWVCGMLAAGYITLEDVLNADVDAFYGPDQNTFIRKGHFICLPATIEYVMSLERSHSTREVVEGLNDGQLALNQLGKGVRVHRVKVEKDNESEQIEESMTTLISAKKMYDKGDFESAADLFERAIKEDPNNMEAYSSLALTYKKLGDKNKSLEYYEKCTETVKECNAYMNQHRDLLYDAGVKASSYYNAGLAREAMAKIYEDKGESGNAQANYNKALQNYKTARENAIKAKIDTNVYDNAINRITKIINGGKKVAFDKANKKLKKKAQKSKLLQTEKNAEGRA